MKKEYNFKEIEKKWQKRWEKEDAFEAIDFHPTKPKYYVLYEFFNVSGNLHMGHLKGSVPADALARYKRLKGYNVLFPIGGDAFGLPAENAAIKSGINPSDFVKDGMERVINQSKALGLSFDWKRVFATSDADYYKWTQWIFLQFLKKEKAYKKKGLVNFCPNCKTVLSNEDSQDNKCDRCGGEIIQEERWVWFLKMKEYSEKLLGNVDRIDMVESLKDAQRNWIGKSQGLEFDLKTTDGKKISVYTTRADTVFGITFIVLAPEHKYITKNKNISNQDEIKEYINSAKLKKVIDRKINKEKTGVMLQGVSAINPFTNKEIPIYVGDYVLADHGTGAVIAVPAHDQRDYEFAKKFNLPIIPIIDADISQEAYEGDGKHINSDFINGLNNSESIKKVIDYCENQGIGKRMTTYRMTDWSFNRQRYWGEPFPVILCDKCGIVPMEEKDLPLLLPKIDNYQPDAAGNSPLSRAKDWVITTCPICNEPARRETDTMPNWAGSSWYWLRYIDPHNNDELASFDKLKYWGSVDCYTGGTEHITRHVLYAFFWQNFLYEIGAVPSRDPFIRKMGSGLILDDTGKKMSKSSTNGISPMEVIEEYGSDTARLHLHFLGGYEDNTPWTLKGIEGITTFLRRVWSLQEMIKGDSVSKEHIYDLNRLVKKISEDLEDLKLNTAIAAYMSFIKKVRESEFITKEELRQFLIVLNPLAPHITSEIFENVFNKNILNEVWPTYDSNYLVEKTINLPVQINGKMRGLIEIDLDTSQEDILNIIKADSVISKHLSAQIKKVIYIPNKIINIIL